MFYFLSFCSTFWDISSALFSSSYIESVISALFFNLSEGLDYNCLSPPLPLPPPLIALGIVWISSELLCLTNLFLVGGFPQVYGDPWLSLPNEEMNIKKPLGSCFYLGDAYPLLIFIIG